ncbi:TetR/AcrR family transcriptional regulator [Curtobacterium sp. MCBD17_013]|nr:TetR/AcrR family transcriptional regulator [Curtobacterium sp. MCBD17_013]
MRRIRLFPEFGINVPDMPTTSHPDREARPLRADALRNRERILATARRLFAERGISVTLNDVAHEAGVGVGTVYRRFPDKHALVDALLSAKFETLSALVERAAACPTGREAMRAYLLGALELRASDRALADVIVRAHPASPALRRDRDRIDAEMTALVDRAHREGALREGFQARDVPMLVVMVGAVADRTRACDPDLWRRYGQMLIDGVCPPAVESPLRGRPLERQELELALNAAPA